MWYNFNQRSFKNLNLSFLFTSVWFWSDMASFTSLSSASGLSDPSFPVLPSSFQTRIEANLVDRNYSIEAAEYADTKGNRAALVMITNGDETSIIYDYKAQQIFFVKDDHCTTKFMSNDSTADSLFGYVRFNGSAHMFTTKNILKFAQSYGQTYKGPSEIRGIPCQRWQSHLYWNIHNANFTLDYYFSDLTWKTSSTYPQSPVRADVTGVVVKGTSTRHFHHIYDYYDFRPSINPDEFAVFETPPSVSCPKRTTIKLIPRVAAEKQFYFRVETVDKQKRIDNMQVWYDQRSGIIRYDKVTDDGKSITHMEDYNRGITYRIYKQTGNCVVAPITESSYGAKRVGNGSHWFLSLKSPLELLGIQESFVYVGQRIVREMTADLFVANVPPRMFAGATLKTISAYFLRSGSERSDKGVYGDQDQYNHTLLRVDKGNLQTLNFYDFEYSHPNPLEMFDITPCYPDDQQLGFRMKIPVGQTQIQRYDVLLTNAIQEQLSTKLELEPNRIQKLQVRGDTKNLYVTGRLLQRPPSLARYFEVKDHKLELVDNQFTAKNVNECASSCDAHADCVSFFFCGSTCYISHLVQKYTHPNGRQGNTTCSVYSAVVKRPPHLQDHNLTFVWNSFVNQVQQGNLWIDFGQANQTLLRVTEVLEDEVTKSIAMDTMTTVSSTHHSHTTISGETTRSSAFIAAPSTTVKSSSNTTSGDWVTGYTLVAAYTTQGSAKLKIGNVASPQNCGVQCNENHAFRCKAFQYCSSNRMCRLMDARQLPVPLSMQGKTSCLFYTREYLTDFKKQKSGPIKTQHFKPVQGVSVQTCAHICALETSCPSFQYCPTNKNCLVETTDQDVNYGASSQADCQYYTRSLTGPVRGTDQSQSLNNGAIAGAAVGMLIAGIVIGIAAINLIKRFRGRQLYDVDMSMNHVS